MTKKKPANSCVLARDKKKKDAEYKRLKERVRNYRKYLGDKCQRVTK